MPDIALTPQQLAVICALSSGVTTLAAAEQAGIHRNTINHWRRNSLPFQRALADAQYDRALHFREKIEAEVDLAIQTLHDLLTDPKTPPSVRLKAALAIIQTASTPLDPKKQIELVMETIAVEQPPSQPEPVHNDAQPAPQIATAAVHNDEQPDAQTAPEPPAVEPPQLHNDAQPTPPEIFVNSRPFAARSRRPVARNAQCPCGSGKKYKRCCLESLAAAA